MKFSSILLAALAIGLGLPQPAGAAPLQPIKPWVVDYADTRCSASRMFGSEDEPVTFALRPSPRGNVMQIVIVQPGRARSVFHVPATATFGSRKLKGTALRFGSSDKKSEIVWLNFERTALEGLKDAEQINIYAEGVTEESFALPAIADVLKVLGECNRDLQDHWNVADGEDIRIATPATPVKPLVSIFSSSDYPAQAFHEGAGGTTQFILMIDEMGTVRDCMVEATSGIASLDAMTCGALLERAKFHPALDASGKGVRSIVSSRVTWRMP